jgi:hypothetical protein
VAATGNATAKTFLEGDGRWGALSARAFTGLERILAKGGLVKGSLPAPSDLFTNALLPKR